MNKSVIIFFVFNLFIVSACRKVVSFDIESEETPVLNCLFTNDSLWQITLSHSIAVNEESKFDAIKNARIDIYEDGQYYTTADIFRAPKDTVSIAYYTISDLNAAPRPGHVYSIEAQAEEWPLLSAFDTLKPIPSFEHFELNNMFIEEIYLGIDSRPIYSLSGDLSLKVKNNLGRKDYYAIKVYYVANVYPPRDIAFGQDNFVDSTYKDVVGFSTTEALGFESYLWKDGYIFTDSLNTDEFINLHLFLDGFLYKTGTAPDHLYLELKSLSEPYYHFQKSYVDHLQTALNPFSTPKAVFSNIENGVGVFAGASVVLDSIRLE